MKLIPLKQWICDNCGGIIETVKDGWLEWYEEKNAETDGYYSTGFRIVHHERDCQYNGDALHASGKSLSDTGLRYYTGPDGLTVLLGMIEEMNVNLEQMIEIIRRLHLPNYEEARQYWERAVNEGFIVMDCVATRCYTQSYLQLVIKEYGDSQP